jgi:protein-L-isoaspartate(D-aspartate) O-methyltransferase
MNYDIARKRMVEGLEKSAPGRIPISDRRVLDALLRTPRHIFVEEAMAAQAYCDTSLPIGEKQTISQPYIVGLMSQMLSLTGTEKVLELGTGSGYQAAILARLADRVYTVERIRALALRARKALDSLGYHNVNIRIGDGTAGWVDESPFDAILVTAGAPDVPQHLVDQLRPGTGRLVIPVGTESDQVLVRITKAADGSVHQESTVGCRFVKLIGECGWKPDN